MKYGFIEDISDINFTLPQAPPYSAQFIPKPLMKTLNFILGARYGRQRFQGSFLSTQNSAKKLSS